MYVADGVGGGIRPDINLGVAGMRIYSGSAIFSRFEAQKMTFVIESYRPEEVFLSGEGRGVKTPGNFSMLIAFTALLSTNQKTFAMEHRLLKCMLDGETLFKNKFAKVVCFEYFGYFVIKNDKKTTQHGSDTSKRGRDQNLLRICDFSCISSSKDHFCD